MMRWPPSRVHIVREIWGEFKNPWGLGTQAFHSDYNIYANIYANAVNEIKAIVLPIWFADFI